MSQYLIRRVLGTIPLLLGVALLSFVFMHLAPGGPTTLFAKNARMSQAQLDQIEHNMGLDRPLPAQFLIWVTNLLQGDLGTSFFQNRPVSDVIWDAFPNTVILMTAGLTISLFFSLVLGVVGAVRQYGIFDNASSFFAYFGLAMPVFWFGLMLQIVFSVKLGWLPSANMHSATGGGTVDMLKHLLLPAIAIAIGSIASWSRYVRASMLEVMAQDHVRTARAKGLREESVLRRHILRNALIPFVTVIAIDIPLYLAGAVLVETVFSWPGMGRLFYDSLTKRDYPVLMGVLMLGALLIVIGNLIADVVYGMLDPRIKYS